MAISSAKKGRNTNKSNRNQNKRGKKRIEKVGNENLAKNMAEIDSATPSKSGAIKPSVEYQEKSTVEIRPSHNSLPLSTPVKHTEDFASKDNSVDGFLSIKH